MRWLLAVLLAVPTAASAQQAVPEIAYDSVPNFLKLPADLHLGEVPGTRPIAWVNSCNATPTKRLPEISVAKPVRPSMAVFVADTTPSALASALPIAKFVWPFSEVVFGRALTEVVSLVEVSWLANSARRLE